MIAECTGGGHPNPAWVFRKTSWWRDSSTDLRWEGAARSINARFVGWGGDSEAFKIIYKVPVLILSSLELPSLSPFWRRKWEERLGCLRGWGWGTVLARWGRTPASFREYPVEAEHPVPDPLSSARGTCSALSARGHHHCQEGCQPAYLLFQGLTGPELNTQSPSPSTVNLTVEFNPGLPNRGKVTRVSRRQRGYVFS